MTPRGLFTITRPVNAFVAGIGALLGYLVAAGTLDGEALVLVPVVALITAAGNGINDYFDRDIDRINRPDRPIPSGAVTPRGALLFSAVLFAAGIAFALFTNPLCFAIALFNTVVLVLYAAYLKGMPLVGNASVAYLSASIFLFGGALAGIGGLVQNIPLAGMVFLAMIARELLKDAEDIEGDAAGGARTLPMIVGVRVTAAIALVTIAGAVVMSSLPLARWWGAPYLAAISIADLILLAGAVQGVRCTSAACVRSSRATGILKAGMFVALAVFILAALFV